MVGTLPIPPKFAILDCFSEYHNLAVFLELICTNLIFKGQLHNDREQTSGCQGTGLEERHDYREIAQESFLK